jgi:hypothetical protein
VSLPLGWLLISVWFFYLVTEEVGGDLSSVTLLANLVSSVAGNWIWTKQLQQQQKTTRTFQVPMQRGVLSP